MNLFIKMFSLIFLANYGETFDVLPKKDGRFFEVIIDRFETLLGDDSFFDYKFRVKKINNTRVYFGYVALFQPIGNDIHVEVKTLKKQGGEYRYLPYTIPPTPLCDLYGNDVYCWAQIAKKSDFPLNVKENCPLIAKNYSINGATCDLENVPKVMSSGDYAGEINFHKNGAVGTVFRVYGTINNI